MPGEGVASWLIIPGEGVAKRLTIPGEGVARGLTDHVVGIAYVGGVKQLRNGHVNLGLVLQRLKQNNFLPILVEIDR